MDYLREGIGWRGLSQRDPLVEYKREGFDIFQEMERGLKEDYVTYIYRIENVVLREAEMQQLSYSGGGEEPDERSKSPSEGRRARSGATTRARAGRARSTRSAGCWTRRSTSA